MSGAGGPSERDGLRRRWPAWAWILAGAAGMLLLGCCGAGVALWLGVRGARELVEAAGLADSTPPQQLIAESKDEIARAESFVAALAAGRTYDAWAMMAGPGDVTPGEAFELRAAHLRASLGAFRSARVRDVKRWRFLWYGETVTVTFDASFERGPATAEVVLSWTSSSGRTISSARFESPKLPGPVTFGEH